MDSFKNLDQTLTDILEDIHHLYHVPVGVRDHIASCAALSCSFAEKEPECQETFLKLYVELLKRLHLYFLFSIEHTRQDTKECLNQLAEVLMGSLVPENGLEIYLEQLRLSLEKMDQISDEFFNQTIIRYQADVQKLTKLKNALQKDESIGLTEPIKAIWKKYPQSAILKDYRKQIKRFYQFLKNSQEQFEQSFKGPFFSRWQRFRSAGRSYELAKYYALRFQRSKKLKNIDTKFESVLTEGNAIERLNRAYYSLRGKDIYRDFFTKASGDSFLSYGDADHFFSYVQFLLRSGKKLPQTLNVVECGIGDGRFAADFLNRLALLDLEFAAQYQGIGEPELIYPRVQYHLYDFSQKMLDEAKEHSSLKKHERNTNFHVLDANQDTPNPKGGIFYGRFHELFDDIPQAPLIFVNSEGKFFELRVALSARDDLIVRNEDFGQGDEKKFFRLLKSKRAENFSEFHPETLEKIEVSCKLSPISLKTFPYGKEIKKVVGDFRDCVFPFSIGAMKYLERISKNLVCPGGYIQIFDYGYAYPNLYLHQPYYYVSQVNRRFGGSLTNDISYPLFGVWAKENDFKTSIFLQEKFVEKVTEKPMLDTTPFVPSYSGRSLIRHVSIPAGMFHLRHLRQFEAIQESQKRLKGKRNDKRFLKWIKNLQEKGCLGKGLPVLFHASCRDDLENLAFCLDFWVNGLYQCLVEKENLHWIPLEHEFIRKALDDLGYDSQEIFKQIHENPYYGAFWVLRLRRS